MASTPTWCAPVSGRAAVGCVLLVVAAVTGCDRAVDGSVSAASSAQQVAPKPPKTLPELLVEPGRFPVNYPAAALDPLSVRQAIADIDGVGAGDTVEPPQCAPVQPGPSPAASVAVQGIDAATSSSLTVTLTRVSGPLVQRLDQVRSCPSFTSTAADQEASVATTVLPAPPVDSDESFAVDQVVDRADGRSYRLTVLVAQVVDVRITAAWMSTRDDVDPDTEALDPLFTDAVLRVRRDVGP